MIQLLRSADHARRFDAVVLTGTVFLLKMTQEQSGLPLAWTGFPARKVFEETSKCPRDITQGDG
jgi:hypothetical protein